MREVDWLRLVISVIIPPLSKPDPEMINKDKHKKIKHILVTL